MRRRSLLGAGLIGGAVLALGGDAAMWWPALLMRSNAPDPGSRLGARNPVRPVVMSVATFAQQVGRLAGRATDHLQ
jgi:hypothetical protein